MTNKSPLGNNHGWVTHLDFTYTPRDLDQQTHALLALSAVLQDPELFKIERTLGYAVVLRVLVGKYTLHIRIYKRDDVEKHPDNLPSRMAERDAGAFMIFSPAGGLELLEGSLRERAQSHRPQFYADRRLSPNRILALDNMESQLRSSVPEKYGMPKASIPLPHEEWVEVDDREAPSLEPATDDTRTS